MANNETVKGNYLQHSTSTNDKGTIVHHYLFQIPVGIAEVTIASPKYWEYLGKNEDFQTPTPELLEQKLLTNNTAGGTDLFVLKEGFSLTPSMFLKGETQLALKANGQPNTLGAEEVTITKVEADDDTVLITLSDGAVGKRSFVTKVDLPQPDGTTKAQYFSDVAKKARFFQREFNQSVTPTTVGTFDPMTLVGGKVTYKVNMSNFTTPPKPWLEFSEFVPATAQPSGQGMSEAEINAIIGGQA